MFGDYNSKEMKKIILVTVVLLTMLSVKAQIKKKIDYTYQDRNGYLCNSTLYIIGNEAVYKINDERKNGFDEKELSKSNIVFVNNDKLSTFFYSNKKTAITRIPLYETEIIYTDDDPETKWKFTGNRKKINKYNCQEAKLELNGRKYTLWFTPEIEINYGPYKINGLPGMVLEFFEETNNIKITFKSIQELKNDDDFVKLKKYIQSKTVLSYGNYSKKITEMMSAKKIKTIAKASELGAEITYEPLQKEFTQYLIDIPTNLVSELQKIN